MNEEESAEIGETSQYPYSVKITQSPLGARISVHAYANNQADAIDDAVSLYVVTREQLRKAGYPIAPEEKAAPKRANGESK